MKGGQKNKPKLIPPDTTKQSAVEQKMIQIIAKLHEVPLVAKQKIVTESSLSSGSMRHQF
jgi:hypothetical protein